MTELFNDLLASILGAVCFMVLVALGLFFWQPLAVIATFVLFGVLWYKGRPKQEEAPKKWVITRIREEK